MKCNSFGARERQPHLRIHTGFGATLAIKNLSKFWIASPSSLIPTHSRRTVSAPEAIEMMGSTVHLPCGLRLELSRRSQWRVGSTVAAVNGCESPVVYSFTLRTDQSTRAQPYRFWQNESLRESQNEDPDLLSGDRSQLPKQRFADSDLPERLLHVDVLKLRTWSARARPVVL